MGSRSVGVRLAPDLVERLDALVPRFSTRWRQASRSEVLRAVITTGLEPFEAEAAGGDEAGPAAAQAVTARGEPSPLG